ncbi:hypothetical protein [Sphaerisporangium sp. NPDC051011]|uniref:hypothetical protein n=1 Tax=Sphaerisporangium sp. NPDC051011 TaxID=3155792 RepID=UPI0033FFD58C
MSEETAVWIRGNAWPEWRRWPGREPDLRCPCEWTPHCERGGDHETCRRLVLIPHCETYIMPLGGGWPPVNLPEHERMEHPTMTVFGPRRTTASQVWLADRACRYLCGCSCHVRQLDLFSVDEPAGGKSTPQKP